MLKKLLIIVLLFYFFILLKDSFLMHFSLFGVVPNLVFILFSLLVFFEKKDSNLLIIFYALIAGLLTDIFSYSHIGPAVISLIVIGLLFKKVQLSLKNTSESYPLSYFLSLFTIFLLTYKLLIATYLYFYNSEKIINIFGWDLVFYLIYNALVATVGYYIYKKYFFKVSKW